jgi:hypothetical protein
MHPSRPNGDPASVSDEFHQKADNRIDMSLRLESDRNVRIVAVRVSDGNSHAMELINLSLTIAFDTNTKPLIRRSDDMRLRRGRAFRSDPENRQNEHAKRQGAR